MSAATATSMLATAATTTTAAAHQGGKFARMYEGWSDAQILALMQRFRERALEYVYGGAELFATSATAHLPDKSEAEIAEMMRALMSQFALAIDTKAFYNEVVTVDGQSVVVHLHLHETTAGLEENRAGGIWHPDELRRFFEKIRKYLDLLQRSADLFFSRVQIPPKSVAHTQSKFYALRDLTEREKKASETRARSELEEMRFRVLDELFCSVSPAPVRKKDPTIYERRPQLWSPTDQAHLLELLNQITHDVQTTGTSALVPLFASKLGRTEVSCKNKIADMRKLFRKKRSDARFNHLPDELMDTSTMSHKIFSSNWADPNDPYAVGMIALRAHLRLKVTKKKMPHKRKVASPTTTVTTRKVRQAMSSQQTASSSKSKSKSKNSAVVATAAAAAPITDFVREMAQQHGWTEQRTRDVCVSMHRFLHLYRTLQLKAFYAAVLEATPGVSMPDVCFPGNAMLKLFEKRHGSLDSFGEVALGLALQPQPDAAASSQDTEPNDAEPAVSYLASSPLLGFSDVEQHDESSPEDDQPMIDDDDDDDDDDEVDTLSLDSTDMRSSSTPPSSCKTTTQRNGYPIGKSYGKSNEILKHVKTVCQSCRKRKRKRKQKQKQKQKQQHANGHTSDDDDADDDDDDDDEDDDDEDDDDDDDDDTSAQDPRGVDESEADVHWRTLLQSVDARMVALEDRNRELVERKEDRERQQQRKQWRTSIQLEVRSTYQGMAANAL